jgi:bacterioferritin (cytochrome b1)
MREELGKIIHDAYIRERKLNLLYSMLDEIGDEADEDDFFRQACDDQTGSLQVLQDISRKYGEPEIDPGILEKLGESVLQLRSGRRDREELMRQSLEFESELVEGYKKSLRFLTTDDYTRKLVNKMLTVKLGHKRDLLDKLNR